MLRGTLDDFDLRYVFRLLSFAHKTGKLSVGGPAGAGRVFFRSGEVYHAESDLPRDGFGRKLVKAGKITQLSLRQTLDYCAASGARLGEALVDRGLVAQLDLESALREEIEEVVIGLFRNERGQFVFEDDEQVESDTLIQVGVETLIQEDSQTVRKRVPSLNPSFVRASISQGDDMEISITWPEWSLIALIDGRRSVGEIAARLGLDELAVVRGLRRLLTVGLVTLPADSSERLRGNPSSLPAEGSIPASGSDQSIPTLPPPPPPLIDLTEEERIWIHENH